MNGDCVIICLYVDDMLIFGTCIDIVLRTKSFLASNFDMKDMGEASVILGVKIIRKRDNILLSQEHHVEKILKKFDYYDSKSVSTPYDANSQLRKNRGDLIAQRHIQLRHNMVKQLFKDGTISIDNVKLEGNLADPLIKPLGKK
uniref:Retrovirus-related Pol polyprotein from transposon TNT 1-94 n=1 Tax=Cajanus cajan TaxID=3821 RepID=A0A151RYR3_CAJCA|nr:Retrovirus-related Pol polyprotein from transposon TNT 1-94 [Cajanus cajan]